MIGSKILGREEERSRPAEKSKSLSAKFLLTGLPGSGKTTVITALANFLGDWASGFYTTEIRVSGKRKGFEVIIPTTKLA
ncbi:MAG: nucleoside-triphosphatase [Syntrophales bacterium]|nr:nucleoside-triphosphatase [Syntrophales bacterium]